MLTTVSPSILNYKSILFQYSLRLIQTKETLVISSFNKKGLKSPNTIFELSDDNTLNIIRNCKRSRNPINYFMNKHVLPRHYPQSIKPGYIHFTLHSLLTNTLINTMNFLSTQMLINKLGLSTMKTNKLSAGLNWVLKNGIGQITSFFYASNLSHAFERNTKQWRILSVLIGNSSLFIEILCNKLTNPFYILLFASFAQALKLCGVFGISSSQIGINQHFCNEHNITDLQRKYFSQNQIGFCLGSIIGLIISLNVGLSPLIISKIIGFISLIYIILSYRSFREIYFETLNVSRSKILFEEYITKGNVLGVEEVNKKEGAMFSKVKELSFGCSIENIIQVNKEREYLREIMNMFNKEKWLIYVDIKKNKRNDKKTFEVMTSLSETANCEDVIEAFYSSMKIIHLLNQKVLVLNKEIVIDILKEELSNDNSTKRKEMIEAIKAIGYDLQKNLLENNHQRYSLEKALKH